MSINSLVNKNNLTNVFNRDTNQKILIKKVRSFNIFFKNILGSIIRLIKKSKNQFLIFFLFFVVSALFPFAYFKEFKYDNLYSSGDYLYLINAKELLENGPFVHSSIFSNAYGQNNSLTLTLFVPVFILFYFLTFLGANGTISLVIFIFLMQFFSAFSMYYYLVFLFKKFDIKNNYSLISVIFAIFYSYSPFYYVLFKPGHFFVIILFATFPLILKYFDLFIHDLNVKYLIYLFFLLFINATSFSNVAMPLVLFAFLFLYSSIFLICNKIKLNNFILSSVFVIIAFLLSNLWWLLPTITDFSNFSELNQQSKDTIGQSISYATKDSSVLNSLVGEPLSLAELNSKFHFSFDQYIAYIYLIIFLVITFSWKKFRKLDNKVYFTVFMIFIVLSIYFTKGPREPFSNVFMYLYNNVFGFQIFRRPASKIYWVYLFSFSTLGAISFYYVLNFIKNNYYKVLIYLFLISSCLSFVYMFSFSKDLKSFNVPVVYYDARDYFEEDNATSILLFPDLNGLNPTYNNSVNNLSGIDFIDQVWEYRKYIPSKSKWTLDTGERTVINILADRVYNNISFCEESKNLNLSHVVIRKDIVIDSERKEILKKIESNLSNSIYIKDKKDFGESFTVFSIKDECRSEKILVNDGQATFYKYNPIKYRVYLNTSKKGNLLFLEAFDDNWGIYLGKNNLNTLDIAYLYKKRIFDNTHKVAYDYANSWEIDPEYIKQNFDKSYYKENTDGSIDIKLTLYFKRQSYFYLGLLIFGTSLLSCIIYLAYYYLNRWKKKNKELEKII